MSQEKAEDKKPGVKNQGNQDKDAIIKQLQERITVLENTLRQYQETMIALKDAYEKLQQNPGNQQPGNPQFDPNMIGAIISLLKGGSSGPDPLTAALSQAIKEMILAQAEAMKLQNKIVSIQYRKMLNKLLKETPELIEEETSGPKEETGPKEEGGQGGIKIE